MCFKSDPESGMIAQAKLHTIKNINANTEAATRT